MFRVILLGLNLVAFFNKKGAEVTVIEVKNIKRFGPEEAQHDPRTTRFEIVDLDSVYHLEVPSEKVEELEKALDTVTRANSTVKVLESHSVISEAPKTVEIISGVKPALDRNTFEINKTMFSSKSELLVLDNNYFEIKVFVSGKPPVFQSAFLINDIKSFSCSSGKTVTVEFKENLKLPTLTWTFGSETSAASFLKNLKTMKICLTNESRESLGSNGIPLSSDIKRQPWLSCSEGLYVAFHCQLTQFLLSFPLKSMTK